MITLEFEIDPIPKGRPRFSRFGGTYTPTKTRDYESSIETMARYMYRKDPLDGPLQVFVEIIAKKPKTSKLKHPKGDVDNYAKAVLDSLNEILWNDDAQIVSLHCSKRFGDSGKVIVTVTPFESIQFSEAVVSALQSDL
jgi:Holliday junction resolvase RusA-like endonuclease